MLIEPPNINSSRLKAFFTTKDFNKRHNEIRTSLSKELGISEEYIYLPEQRHTDKIHLLGSLDECVIADAVITDKRNMLIGVMVADCVPILLYDRNRGVIGAVHAGWRGTAKQILKKTISAMHESLGSSVRDISVAIGPGIRLCSYEVGIDVVQEIKDASGEADYCQKRNGKYFLDLPSANRFQALHMGISDENIWLSDECTFCNPDKFYSYRYNNKTAGRQGAFIIMWYDNDNSKFKI